MLIIKHQIKGAKFSDNYYISLKYLSMPKYNAKAHETGIKTDKV